MKEAGVQGFLNGLPLSNTDVKGRGKPMGWRQQWSKPWGVTPGSVLDPGDEGESSKLGTEDFQPLPSSNALFQSIVGLWRLHLVYI